MSRDKDILQRVENNVSAALHGHNMVEGHGHIVAALSGGADSVCLLLVLKNLRERLNFSLSAVHINHNLRGEESDRDRDFCLRLCEREGIPIRVYSVNAAEYAVKMHCSVEEAARILRYDCFEKESERIPGAVIATAHNMGDNTETVLFNLTRGTGVRGLGGIPYKRDNIIRPLLDVSRGEIEGYLKAAGQDFVTDSTNLTDDYTRNRVRHRVIPELLKINSGLHRAVSRLCESAAEDEECLDSLARQTPPEKMSESHSAVRKRYIRNMLEDSGIAVNYDRLCELDRLLVRQSGKYNLSGDIYAVFGKSGMEIKELPRNAPVDFFYKVDFEEIKSYEYFEREYFIAEFDKTVKIKRCKYDNFTEISIIHKNLTNNIVDCDKIKGVVIIRPKRDGDSCRFKGKDFTTRLKKLYNGMKLPLEERSRALVMEDEEGIIWSEYGGAAERVAYYGGENSLGGENDKSGESVRSQD
ncbi:MAG: tRNA lysidine(34) synthetase TilS [Oscillospiraceae bacterium]|nr:tRNA lysidine(34) synthetase TilS [Oscillospiraceae bacterium]